MAVIGWKCFCVDRQAKYTKELQAYLQATGLKASDLAKPRSRKGRVQGKPSSLPAAVHVSQAGVDDAARGALPHFQQVWASGPQQVTTAHNAGQMMYSMANAFPLTTVYRLQLFCFCLRFVSHTS